MDRYRCTVSANHRVYFWRQVGSKNWHRVSWYDVPYNHSCRKKLPTCLSYHEKLSEHRKPDQHYPCRVKYTVFNKKERLGYVRQRHVKQKKLHYQLSERQKFLDQLELERSTKKQSLTKKKKKNRVLFNL